jgi:hypothetical protein
MNLEDFEPILAFSAVMAGLFRAIPAAHQAPMN